MATVTPNDDALVRHDGEPLPPNLFIIGAPKCGTTALSHYLAQHPQVFMTESVGVKEPHFFCSDHPITQLHPIRDYDEYIKLFPELTHKYVYIGEASTSYLFSDVAVPRIIANNSESRIIVALRNPIEMAIALHNEYQKYSNEISSFERAWRLQGQRLSGAPLPRPFSDPVDLQYGILSKTGAQVQRLFTRIDRKQVHIIIYDDLKQDTQGCYEKLLAWLGLPPDPDISFDRLNAGRNYRSTFVEKSLRQARRVREALHIPGGLGVNALIDRFNVTRHYRPLRPAFEQELKDYFRDDVRLLSAILGRDLTHWTD